eukprot:GFKZ01013941.1.p1 GENE.GFKZ01013941.1~~GFKZ01013941.1.p1  ORF type:complete len:442 (-),score=56.47 GFKZ01013941.1:701-2026(-)
MNSFSICRSLRSALRLSRRHSKKIAFFTLTAGAAVALATYIRSQLAAVNASLENHRIAGARNLRLIFLSNVNAIRLAFRPLMAVAAEVFQLIPMVDSTVYLQPLQRGVVTDRVEKRQLWEGIKVAAVTRLISSVYVVAIVYAVLCLEMNLIARYTSSTTEAPIQGLPAGRLQETTVKTFLERVKARLLAVDCVQHMVAKVEKLVRRDVSQTPLTMRLTLFDVQSLFEKVLAKVGEPESGEIGGSVGTDDVPKGLAVQVLQTRVLAGDDSQPEVDCSVARDPNLDWLLKESLDLCEILEFDRVVQGNADAVLKCVMSWLKADVFDGENSSEKTVPFATLFARFDALAVRLLREASQDSEDHDSGVGGPGLDKVLAESEYSAQFAASVFLSGEKERERPQSQSSDRENTMVAGREHGDHFVTNVSESVSRSMGDDLGMMFDIK